MQTKLAVEAVTQFLINKCCIEHILFSTCFHVKISSQVFGHICHIQTKGFLVSCQNYCPDLFCRPVDGESYLQVNLPEPLPVPENSTGNWTVCDGCYCACEDRTEECGIPSKSSGRNRG